MWLVVNFVVSSVHIVGSVSFVCCSLVLLACGCGYCLNLGHSSVLIGSSDFEMCVSVFVESCSE